MNSHRLAIIQARLTSTRLPGKVLSDICGEPMLMRQISRVRTATRIDQVVVATSNDATDDPIADFCRANAVEVYRGNLEDVLDRFRGAACAFSGDIVVRLTGDCPLADPIVIDRVIEAFEAAGYDYASNILRPTFPDGLDVEVMSRSTLERAWKDARLPSEREHVTPYVYKHPEVFRLLGVENPRDLSALRWTVDNAADLAFVRRVYASLLPRGPGFGMDDVLALLAEQPDLAAINAGIRRNEGYERSLARDPATADKVADEKERS
jgi:spore coat polysaccharide biosynthesis protein SpsF